MHVRQIRGLEDPVATFLWQFLWISKTMQASIAFCECEQTWMYIKSDYMHAYTCKHKIVGILMDLATNNATNPGIINLMCLVYIPYNKGHSYHRDRGPMRARLYCQLMPTFLCSESLFDVLLHDNTIDSHHRLKQTEHPLSSSISGRLWVWSM